MVPFPLVVVSELVLVSFELASPLKRLSAVEDSSDAPDLSAAVAGAEREPAAIATAVVAATRPLREKSFMKLLLSVKSDNNVDHVSFLSAKKPLIVAEILYA